MAFTVIQNRKVHYEEKGEGEVIIFVHGWGGTIESLRQLAKLASKNYRTIILDLPGFGKSDNPDLDWGVEEYTQFILDFLKTLKIDKVIYFGHSFGGSIGIYLSVTNPYLIDKLILSGSAYKRTPPQSSNLKSFVKKIIGNNTLLKKIIYSVLYPSSDSMKFPHLETNFRKIITQDLTKYAVKIKAPTLILWGDKDTYTPVQWAYELNQSIINSKLKVFPGITHGLPLKYPQMVYEEIKNFLKKS